MFWGNHQCFNFCGNAKLIFAKQLSSGVPDTKWRCPRLKSVTTRSTAQSRTAENLWLGVPNWKILEFIRKNFALQWSRCGIPHVLQRWTRSQTVLQPKYTTPNSGNIFWPPATLKRTPRACAIFFSTALSLVSKGHHKKSISPMLNLVAGWWQNFNFRGLHTGPLENGT